MNNKLSELSKPVGNFRKQPDGSYWPLSKSTATMDMVPLYSQEYVSALREDAAKWFKAFEKAVSVGARYEERIEDLEQAMRHIHGAALDITVPRTAIAKAAEFAADHTANKERSNG